MNAIASTPPAIAATPSSDEADFRNTKPPRNAGIAAKTAIECVVTGFPQDWQLMMRPGPSPDLRNRLIAGRLQYGHLTIGAFCIALNCETGERRRSPIEVVPNGVAAGAPPPHLIEREARAHAP
ncbi:MAG: hypothetical protein ACXV7D_15425 [Thermoanaerobaculia bacterium]